MAGFGATNLGPDGDSNAGLKVAGPSSFSFRSKAGPWSPGGTKPFAWSPESAPSGSAARLKSSTVLPTTGLISWRVESGAELIGSYFAGRNDLEAEGFSILKKSSSRSLCEL